MPKKKLKIFKTFSIILSIVLSIALSLSIVTTTLISVGRDYFTSADFNSMIDSADLATMKFIYNSEKITLEKFVKDFVTEKIEKLDKSKLTNVTKNFEDILNDKSVKIVAEVMGGVNPAYDFVKKCLESGKSVVTSNKELVAKYGPELLELAKSMGKNFLFEASVGGGIPIIRPLNQSLTADELTEITGILNGTTNFILSKMAKEGSSFDAVLKEAQNLGYAERNPAADVEGYDACRKIAILSSLAYGCHADFEDIYTEGITKITDIDFKYY